VPTVARRRGKAGAAATQQRRAPAAR
jgi:hypothetical protein